MNGFFSQVPLAILLFCAALGYFSGSIPFGLLLTRAFGLGDLRSIGSGNIGATNALRTGNKALAILTLAGDVLKGTVPVVIAARWGEPAAAIAGLSAFIGHLFPVWLGFKGGKGVATYIGVLLGFAPWGVAVFAAAWLSMAFLFRYSSLAALVATLIVPVALFAMGNTVAALLTGILTVLVYLKHHANIQRLLSGTEGKIGGGK
ncbi:glycerol-3-phosphate 1-O-acyltransferase PlsY [Aureimonas fodinaquatilis]|uniref:Glycerol-3-phosphate acyltransferase n=1 Tax=Aureimonas fodinaquatilis TaxID=2565783 RepID=A0A5B0DW79_9HYPH|nr:glycerol-3-phosphate 1-O-acyltransferase PlsY [Aureimonas fodinaquatilis]KAA0970135.1 glycerol-3-phosphate 1-O-acyltransferase PlsY [Aureimonas fodinaquatilis]